MEVCAGCTTRYSVGAPACPQCGSTERAEGEAVGGVPLTVTVACTTDGCCHHGKPRLVMLRLVAVGVAALPSLVCTGCGAYLGFAWPGSLTQEDNDMPKITVHGGPSIEGAEPLDDGGEQPSAGNSSSTSPEQPETSPGSKKPEPPKRARTTANRSKQDQTGSSTAASTDGGQEDGTSGGSD